MTPVPARGLLFLLAPFAATAALPIWWPGAWSLWVACGLAALFLAAVDLCLRPRAGAVRAARALASEYRVGREGRYALVLENTTRRRLEVSVRQVLPAAFEPVELEQSLLLEAGGRRELEASFLPLERGRFRLLPAALRLRSPLGLFWLQGEAAGGDEIEVVPGRPSGETAVLLARAAQLEEAGTRPIRRRGQDSDFDTLRDYVVGDDRRFVDWKATARRFRPQVRQYRMERNAEVVLALDCGRLMGGLVGGVAKLDLAIVPLLDLAAVALERGERVGLMAFDADVLRFIPPHSGRRQLGVITSCLAGLRTGFRQTSYTRALGHLQAHHRKRALVVVFTDFTDELSARELVLVLAALARRHVLLFAAVGDKHLDDIVAEAPRSAAAVYQKAAASELLLERRRVVGALHRLGVLAVDADPFHLSSPLIQRYLEARPQV